MFCSVSYNDSVRRMIFVLGGGLCFCKEVMKPVTSKAALTLVLAANFMKF